MLRRRTLLAFINAKPAQRYEAIEEFLRLEKFNTFEEKLKSPAVSEFVTSKQVSITLQGRGAGSGGGSP
jgi:hypothetical protein